MNEQPRVRAVIGDADPKREAMQPKQPMVGAGSLVVAMPDGSIREVITVRTYMSASRHALTVKACVWIRLNTVSGDWKNGRGEAGGYGYHKESAAIAAAVRAAGVRLYGDPYAYGGPADLEKPFDFGGSGSSFYPDVFHAIAEAAGYSGSMQWVSHAL
jgi:hypothetical protein